MTAVLREVWAQMIGHCRPAVDYCAQHGVDLRRVAPATAGGPFLVPIRLTPMQRFEVDPDSSTIAVVVEALGPDGESVEDLVAWSMTDPTRVRAAIGRAAVLGENIATNAATCAFGFPLRLYRSPLRWLQEACDGCAIIDMARAVRWLIDIEAPALAAEDDAHAAELHQARIGLIERQRIVVPDIAAVRSLTSEAA